MEIISRGEQVNLVADRLNISKKDVNTIIFNYTTYLQEKISVGETVKFLNICYFKNTDEPADFKFKRETLAYIATEIANKTDMGRVTVLRVLTTLEELIIQDIVDGKGYAIKGLVRIRYLEDSNGVKKVRIKKSVKYLGKPICVVAMNSFKRKVEEYGGENA